MEAQTETARPLKKEGHMRQARNRFFLLLLFVVSACAGAFAQANSEVTGIVTDQTGAVVAGAKITLTDPATGESHATISGGTGLYDVAGLNPANYNLKITAKGFETYEQNGIVVNVSATDRVDIKLTIGAETQTVTVEADALAVQADSNVISTLIDSQQISEIATENRNFAALAALGLGVSSTLPDNNTPMAGAGGSSFSISANGLRQEHNIWLIDGGESDDRGGAGGLQVMPPQDSIAEFNMLTSNYPPDYGIASGATFSLSLKSGTQKFHGSGYEFNRNTDYDANDFFNKFNGANSPRQVLNYNIYGFNIGGPLYIPKVYNDSKQKTFFFWNEEWRNIKQGSSTNVQNTLPTADIPTAGTDLTYVAPAFANTNPANGPVGGITVPETITDPAYLATLASLGLTPGQPFPNNTIPHQLFDANMVAYLHAGVLPKPSTATGQSVESVPAPIKIRDDVARVDHKFNDKWQLLVHYIHENDVDNNAQTFLGWDASNYRTINSSEVSPATSAAIKLSGTISPNLLVEGSINYDGNIIDIDNSKNSAVPSGWAAGSFFTNGRTGELPNVNYGAPYGTQEQMGSAPWHNAAQDVEPKIDISYTMGKHAMKYGFSYNRYTKNQQLFGDANGQYNLTGNSSSDQYSGNQDKAACQVKPAPAGCVVGDGIIDGLLGLVGSYQQQNGQPIRHYVNYTPSIYAMDNWHVTPRLTLQLGVRWDALPQAWERQNFVSNFNPDHYSPVLEPFWNADHSLLSTGPGFTTITSAQSGEPGPATPYYLNGIDLAGQGGIPKQLVTNRYGTIQPRIGFSEDLFGNGKTVLRGGFGTFFERLQGNLIYNSATDSPFAFSPTANQVYFSNPHTSLVNGTTASTPFFDSSEYNMATSFPDPAVAQYSLGIQHELAPAVVMVVQYVGNVAWHQEQYYHMNNFPLTTDPSVRAKGGNVTTYTNQNGQMVTLPGSGQGQTAGNSESFRTYNGFGDITSMSNNTNGGYNGFQAGLRLQNKWGLSGEADYTWSHEIDIQTNDNSCCTSNPWNFKYDKGAGGFDRRQILSINYVYKMPFFNKSQGLVKAIAGGWELAGTATDETGVPTPLTFTQGGDPIGLGGGYTNRPNVVGKMHYSKNVKNWFNTAQVSLPTPSWQGGPNLGFGSAGKDAMVGPGRVNFSTSLYKSFAMTERAHFELRAESFNTFNHTQFNGVNVQLNGGNFGWINSDWGPRTLELGGKFIF
jgi:hypothetical protein